MQHQMFAIKDRAANAFMQPFFTVNENTAVRAIGQAMRDPSHNFVVNAKDYSLYFIGIFDDHTGTLAQTQEPSFVVNCESILASMESRNET